MGDRLGTPGAVGFLPRSTFFFNCAWGKQCYGRNVPLSPKLLSSCNVASVAQFLFLYISPCPPPKEIRNTITGKNSYLIYQWLLVVWYNLSVLGPVFFFPIGKSIPGTYLIWIRSTFKATVRMCKALPRLVATYGNFVCASHFNSRGKFKIKGL